MNPLGHSGVKGHTDAATLRVEADFPGWRVWRSLSGARPACWYASRRGENWKAEPRCVAGETEQELRAELAEAVSASAAP